MHRVSDGGMGCKGCVGSHDGLWITGEQCIGASRAAGILTHHAINGKGMAVDGVRGGVGGVETDHFDRLEDDRECRGGGMDDEC